MSKFLTKIFNSKQKTKHLKEKFHIILLRGMEDLPDNLTDFIANNLDIVAFNSNWFENESFPKKLKRLHILLRDLPQPNKQIIFIGASAGAGLGLSYLIKYPSTPIHRLYSLNGVLKPVYTKNYQRLMEKSHSFSQMSRFLSQHVKYKTIKKYDLKRKVIAFTSGKNDGLLSKKTIQPYWLDPKNIHFVGKLPHTPAIVKALLIDLRSLKDS